LPISHLPRVTLAHAPTPLEAMSNLSTMLGGPNLYVKRDDCTGLAMGGNKARQLEYYLGEALKQNADTLVITGAVQSNFVCQAVAAARKLGMACEVQLEQRVAIADLNYETSGNVLLDRLLGAKIHAYPEGGSEAGADAALEVIADDILARGGNPYVIYLSLDHPPLGALGYIDVAFELLDQAAERGITIDAVVLGSGSAATHAGFLSGVRYRKDPLKVVGVCVRRFADQQASRVFRRCQDIKKLAGFPSVVTEEDVIVIDDYLGPGYGQSTPEMIEAVSLAGRKEGLLLDPVYTGKVLAGLIGLVRDGTFVAGDNVVFLHTGGTPALFGYQNLFHDM